MIVVLSPGDAEGWEGEDDEPIRRRRVGCLARAAAVLAAIGLIGASIAVLQGGGGRGPTAPPDPRDDGVLTAADLAGRTFAVVAMEAGGTPVPLAAEPPSLAFGDASLRLRTGCNGVDARFDVSEAELRVSADPMDLQGCAGTVGAQEGALIGLLLGRGIQPGPARPTLSTHLAGGLLQLWRGDAAAWAVDVTEQATVAASRRERATTVVSRHLAATLPDVTYGVTPSPVLDRWEVVTVLSEPDAAGARSAMAFLVNVSDGDEIVRVPTGPASPFAPGPGATVAPGDRIVLQETPVEGEATAHVNGVEVPTEIEVAPAGRSTTVTVPAWARGDVVVTVTLSTPEAPVPFAVWYRVER